MEFEGHAIQVTLSVKIPWAAFKHSEHSEKPPAFTPQVLQLAGQKAISSRDDIISLAAPILGTMSLLVPGKREKCVPML